MKIPFTKSNGGAQGPASLFAALVLVALVPAVCVLWFMLAAMRNERLAVQERLADVYLNQLTALRKQVTAHWQERQEALQTAKGDSPGQIFAAIVRVNLADGVVVYDGVGKVLYPSAAVQETAVEESGDWVLARELEFQKLDYAAAAEAYGRIAEESRNIHSKARALQSQAGCLLKAGQKAGALARLTQVAADPPLSRAANAQGALVAPNVQLLILKLLGPQPDEPLRALQQDTGFRLVERLNDYSDADLSSSQRRFLMQEVKALGASQQSDMGGTPMPRGTGVSPVDAVDFPTVAAEELAAEYLEQNPALAVDSKLRPTPLPKVWRLATADRTVVALFHEDRLLKEIAPVIASLALPGINVTLLPPGTPFAANKSVGPQEASELLPGWRLGLSFSGDDPLAAASARQTRLYLWTGFAVVLVIALVAILAARYVSAQMRLARLKNELVSTVSHELKTPLASMRAMVDTLSAGRYRDEGQLREYLDLVAKENLRLSHLIENFLAFSRLERGQQHFRFEALAPGGVIAAATAALQEKLGSSHCRFEQHVDPDLPHIRGDADALSTVLVNLLDNAYKYTDGEKRIRARAYANGRHVCFEVEDNGIGIERGETRKIFDRFYQVDQSLTRQRGGCGLGLGIVDYIVRAHHGAVQVESEPGKGSTFRVKIPLAEPAT